MTEFNDTEIENELLNKGYLVHYKAGEKVFTQGQHPTDLYLLKEGIVTLENAKTLARKLVSEKTIFGLRDMLLYEPYKETALVLSDATVILIPKARIMNFLRRSVTSRAFIVRKIFTENIPMSIHYE